MTGRFISFEGGEGSGKSTQLQRLAVSLRATGAEVIETREPGGSPTGERIRAILLDPAEKLDPITQAFLFSASRRDHVVRLIEPALARGAYVLCDRFADSTRAYQGAAGDVPLGLVETLVSAAISSTLPDLTLILDIDPAIGLARAHQRRAAGTHADAFEAADMAFHTRVRKGFRQLAAREPARCTLIDANANADVVQEAVLHAVTVRLGVKGLTSHG
jgi:dTMP kinase